MAKCPKCGLEIERPNKEWNMRPGIMRGQALHVKQYRCPKCDKSFRIADKIAA